MDGSPRERRFARYSPIRASTALVNGRTGSISSQQAAKYSRPGSIHWYKGATQRPALASDYKKGRPQGEHQCA